MDRWGFTTFVEHAPGRAVENRELFGDYDVERRTHIQSRHIADAQETVVTIALDVLKKLRAALRRRSRSFGGLVLATSMPGAQEAAEEVSRRAQIPGPVRGVNYACTGFPAAVVAALNMVNDLGACAGAHQEIVIVTAETLSRLVDWEDKQTAILFGDRAAATTLLQGGRLQIIDAFARVIEDSDRLIELQPRQKALDETLRRRDRDCIVMHGKRIFEEAIGRLVGLVEEVFTEHQSLQRKDLSTVVPHQANGRILDQVDQRLQRRGWEGVRVVKRIQRMGNVASASIPAALAGMQEEIPGGTVVACPAFGAGPEFASGQLTEGMVLMRAA